MNRPTIADIIRSVNDFAPLSLQESWDNSGVQVGATDIDCTGALLCVDATPGIIAEASRRGCNLVIAHHPLLFRGLKRISPGENQVQQTVIDAIRAGITVFASHTSLDSASQGISRRMVQMMGAEPLGPLAPGAAEGSGLGCIARFNTPVMPEEFIGIVKKTFASPVVRCSAGANRPIGRFAVCGGSGGEFLPKVIAEGCEAYLTSDVRYHDFLDFGKQILIADIGHFESEECAKQIFYEIISVFFPNFAVYKSETERNPINYL